MIERIVVATRKSALALAQTRAFTARLRATWPELVVDELGLTTTGDRVLDRPLAELGGKGLFVKELEQALLDGAAHFAVHSAKDLPGELAPGLRVACVPQRVDPRDVLVTRSGVGLAELPAGAVVGTSSLRRQALLRVQRPDLTFTPLRGNVDTRLRRCEEGAVDAVVLAHAGLLRLGLDARVTELLEPDLCLPAVGQGTLAIEARADDARLAALLAPLHDEATARALAAERGVMLAVEGSCHVPLAAYALGVGESLWLRGMLAEPDGTAPRFREAQVPWPATPEAADVVGRNLGHALRGG